MQASAAVTPNVDTPSSASISFTTATLGGTLVDNGGDAVIERGVVYSTTDPGLGSVVGTTLDDGSDLVQADTAGPFTVSVTGLTPGTTYYFQAYARNNFETSRSSVGTFTTLARPTVTTTVNTPTVTTTTVTSLAGNVSSVGGGALSSRGVVYMVGGPTATPTIANTVAPAAGTTTGAFSVNLTGLLTGTQYAYRAYATNGGGTSYGAVRNFTTVTAPPEISLDGYEPTTTSVTLSASVDHAGGLPITLRGFIYSATVQTGFRIGAANTTYLPDTTVTSATPAAAGTFSVEKTGLLPGTTYHYVAFARNTKGTTYSEVSTFTTSTLPPTVTTPSKASITSTSAVLGGFISKSNGLDILSAGVVYSTTDQTPTDAEGAAMAGMEYSSLGTFTIKVEGLTPATRYYFSPFAQNDDGYGYAPDTVVYQFTTLAAAPSVTTGTAGVPSSTSVTVSTNSVTDDNGAAITERGIVVSLSSVSTSPTLGLAGAKAFVHGQDAVGAFSVAATGLLPYTFYSYRAYAKNTRGTSYGVVRSIRTAAGAPTMSKPVATNIAAKSVTLGGTVEKANGDPVNEFGAAVYATSTDELGNVTVGQQVAEATKAVSSIGAYTVNVTGLTPATKYAYVAFATNGIGTGTASVKYFTTLKAVPTVTTVSASATTGIVRGDVTDTNGAAVTRYGVVYSTTDATPKLGEAGVKSKAVTGSPNPDGTFSIELTLEGGETYHYRTFAYNSVGAGYSSVGTLVTDPAKPTVNPRAAASVTATTATLGGKIVSDNGSAIEVRGVRYRAATAQTWTTKIIDGTALGIFSGVVKGLTAGTDYEFQAYAQNELGTTYSEPLTFTTLASSAGLLAKSAEVESGSTVETSYTLGADGQKYLTLVVSYTGQAPTVQVSGNLTDWFSGSSHTTVISDDAGILKVRDNTPVTADSKRYIRVKP